MDSGGGGTKYARAAELAKHGVQHSIHLQKRYWEWEGKMAKSCGDISKMSSPLKNRGANLNFKTS
eukprot:1874506-Ditylum_brightwellii.AAC.1